MLLATRRQTINSRKGDYLESSAASALVGPPQSLMALPVSRLPVSDRTPFLLKIRQSIVCPHQHASRHGFGSKTPVGPAGHATIQLFSRAMYINISDS